MQFRRTQMLAGCALSLFVAGGTAAAQADAEDNESTVVVPGEGAIADTENAPSASDEKVYDSVVVTSSRIARAGFDSPTPTSILNEEELRQGNRPSIVEVLNDMPQFRATVTPATTSPTLDSGRAVADLRGLGVDRTLTLLNGRRFAGAQDLNTVPQSVIRRVDVVTGGASAAWGSGAVAGVVNIILDDKLEGLRGKIDAGRSSRGDGDRYGANLTFGKRFADDRGHLMVALEYLDDEGVPASGRKDRPALESGLFQRANGDQILVHDPNLRVINSGGAILSTTGAPFDLIFNSDGSISPLGLGVETVGQTTVGGDGENVTDYFGISTPYERANIFARASYELTDAATVWLDMNYTDKSSDYPFFPQFVTAPIFPDNAFLSTEARAQLANAGVPPVFIIGRLFTDVGRPDTYQTFGLNRRLTEAAAGLDGKIDEWTYSAYFNHGEFRSDSQMENNIYTAHLGNATDAVLVDGVATCRINANASTADDDAACVPINIFGNGNITPEAAAYSFASRRLVSTTKLDAAGAVLRGEAFSTWAGPVDVAIGTDWRWEDIGSTVDPLSEARLLSTNFTALNGSFDVKEYFGEANVPLLNVEEVAKLEVNGAARYSDYSTSGGIWSWKSGATLRLYEDLLLRAVYSRDIRSPNISELFTVRATNITPLIDPYRTPVGSSTSGVAQAAVTSYIGGNANLVPETSNTLTLGATYSPSFVSGLRLSLDYYDIEIENVIGTLTAQDTLGNCYASAPGDPTCGGVIERAGDGSIASVDRSARNFAEYKTSGLDFEASYVLPLSTFDHNLDGKLSFRAFATHLFNLDIDDGVRVTDRAGIVGEANTFTQPETRFTGTMGYEVGSVAFDVRARYYGSGKWALPDATTGREILNNNVEARTYIDLNARIGLNDQTTLFANVNNVFDVDPPFVVFASSAYDMVGTYYSAGISFEF